MREYSRVSPLFWTDSRISLLSDSEKLLANYLLTGPHATALGAFRLPLGYVASDLRWNPSETLSKGFPKGFETTLERLLKLEEIGFCRYARDLEWVFLPHFLRYNPIENPNQAKLAEKLFAEVPSEAPFRPLLVRALLANPRFLANPFRDRLETLSKPFPNPSETLSKPFRNIEQEQEQEQEQEEYGNFPPTPVPPISSAREKQPSKKGPKEPRKIFAPPTLDEVRAHVKTKGYHFDAEAFLAHYETRGWKLKGTPMVSWQSACVTWEKNAGQFLNTNGNGNGGVTPKPVEKRRYTQDDYNQFPDDI